MKIRYLVATIGVLVLVGGVALVAIAAAVFIVTRRRKRKNPADPFQTAPEQGKGS